MLDGMGKSQVTMGLDGANKIFAWTGPNICFFQVVYFE